MSRTVLIHVTKYEYGRHPTASVSVTDVGGTIKSESTKL